MVSAEKSSEGACARNQQCQLVARKVKIALGYHAYGQCVGLGVVILAELVSVCEKLSDLNNW